MFNIMYLLQFLAIWFSCGVLSFIVIYFVMILKKKEEVFKLPEILGIIAFGALGFVFALIDLIGEILKLIFGTKMWKLEEEIGSIPFAYNKTHELNFILPYNALYCKHKIVKKIETYESTFPTNHPSYFKLKFLKKITK